MKKKAFWKIALAVVAVISFTACTNDESSPLEGIEEALPEGKYPLEIASVTMEAESSAEPWGAKSPQTRVIENEDGMSSAFYWDGTEQIGVQLYADGDVATYTLNDDKTLTPDKTLYWRNTATTIVTAWYPTATTVPLDNQKDKLAYVLKGSGEGNYNTDVTLYFTHALAKVRVALQGDQADKVADVKIKTLTSCTHTQGTVSGSGAEGWITMMPVTYNNVKCYEANVVPGHTITEFQVNGKEDRLNDGGITPLAAKVNTITLTVNKAATEITGGTTITEAGDYIMKGEFTKTITLKGDGIILTLDGVNGNMDIPIKIEQGTPTIILQGNNSLTASGAPAIWLIGENTNVIIKGTENSHLKVSSTNGSAAIGTNYHSYATSEWTPPCGNITIENAFIEASSSYAAAAIGTGVGYQGPGRCGVITIIKSEIKATAVEYLQSGKPAVIGTGGTDGQPMSCAGINITLKDGQNKDEFLNNLTGPYTKVGAGEGLNNASNTCGPINWYNSDGSSAN